MTLSHTLAAENGCRSGAKFGGGAILDLMIRPRCPSGHIDVGSPESRRAFYLGELGPAAHVDGSYPSRSASV